MIETLNLEAVEALAANISDLLPPVADPALRPDVLVIPRRFAPAGLGGYVGLNPDPLGEIYGVRLHASVVVTAKADHDADLSVPVGAIARALTATTRVTLGERGILRIALDTVEAPTVRTGGSPSAAQRRDLQFQVLYEFLKPPDVAEGIIDEIPLDLHMSATGNAPRVLVVATFGEGALDMFEVVDDPLATVNAPSQWQYNAAERRIEQLSAIRGGSNVANANKPGTYLVLRSEPGRPAVRDFSFRATLQSGGNGGIGLVFRWQDVDNFCFFLMDLQRNFRVLGKKVGGTFEHLQTMAVDATQSYETGRPYLVRIVAHGEHIEAFLDGRQVLAGADTSLLAPGRVGLVSHRNDQAQFYRIDLLRM